jgi:hypothetical protein
LICDDARREINGKEIIIGVYGGDIVVPKFPAGLRLTVWIEYSVVGEGEIDLKPRVVTGHGSELFSAELTAQIFGDSPTGTLAVGPVPILMTDPGTLSIELQQQGAEWQTIKTKAVKRSQPQNTKRGGRPS